MASDCTNINEDFISEIENWSAIWDLKHGDYNSKNAKRNAWETVISKFVPNFIDMSEAEKKVIGKYNIVYHHIETNYTHICMHRTLVQFWLVWAVYVTFFLVGTRLR